ncbi:hypothetical protein QR680_011401 [Steinernema hermaphroditum]|uniref:RING-type domain-containing protein n=1 Tax=Steinernema hermaphroditum TaxID=289476 RepID=A0AA39ITN4_9BILA|nr:hypothetical protein QR680_011401 [Steinernema hermaphroditum]
MTSAHVTISVDALQCPICLGIFKATPLMLQCGHSFCYSCIKKITIAEKRLKGIYTGFACPICRNVNQENVQLAKNYALSRVLDSAQKELNYLRKESKWDQRKIIDCLTGMVVFIVFCLLLDSALLGFLWMNLK